MSDDEPFGKWNRPPTSWPMWVGENSVEFKEVGMQENDVEKYEAMARAYCELIGKNPDEHVTLNFCPDGNNFCGAIHYGPAWKNYVEEARRQDAWAKVIAEASQ